MVGNHTLLRILVNAIKFFFYIAIHQRRVKFFSLACHLRKQNTKKRFTLLTKTYTSTQNRNYQGTMPLKRKFPVLRSELIQTTNLKLAHFYKNKLTVR